MEFKLTVTYPDGSKGCDWLNRSGLEIELKQLAKVIDALVIGETITIERIR